jgi:hypothetical protein
MGNVPGPGQVIQEVDGVSRIRAAPDARDLRDNEERGMFESFKKIFLKKTEDEEVSAIHLKNFQHGLMHRKYNVSLAERGDNQIAATITYI